MLQFYYTTTPILVELLVRILRLLLNAISPTKYILVNLLLSNSPLLNSTFLLCPYLLYFYL